MPVLRDLDVQVEVHRGPEERLDAFDRLKRANTETYQKIMLDIIGAPATFAPPRLHIDDGVRRWARDRVSRLFPGSSRPRDDPDSSSTITP